MNKVIFTGRTTADIELRYTQDELAIGTFSLAVDDGYGDKQKTSFFNFSVFGKRAEAMSKYATKGTKIAVCGRAVQDQWTDREGTKRSAIKFICEEWEFAQSKGEQKQGEPVQNEPAQSDDDFMNIPDDDLSELPFN